MHQNILLLNFKISSFNNYSKFQSFNGQISKEKSRKKQFRTCFIEQYFDGVRYRATALFLALNFRGVEVLNVVNLLEAVVFPKK
jgi:hypothetical protein